MGQAVLDQRATAREVLLSASTWRPGAKPEQHDLDGPLPSEGIRWFDLSPAATTDSVMELLALLCQGLTREMVDDLMEPDALPEGRSYADGQIRLASAFDVHPVEAEARMGSRSPAPQPGVLRFDPVEMVASRDWLITNWHPSRAFRGSQVVAEGRIAFDHSELCRCVEMSWAERENGNAADLGISLLRELALTYVPAYRSIYLALENWELQLYRSTDDGDESVQHHQLQDEQLHDLWSSRALLRDWLNPLNPGGLRKGISKAWLPATDHAQVIEVDDRIDKALKGLSELGESLRGAFHIVQIRRADAQRMRAERLQQRLEVAGTIFLIPTLIVGFYGANTWVPGEGRHWGFWIMIGALVVLTLIGYSFVRGSHARANRQAAARDGARVS